MFWGGCHRKLSWAPPTPPLQPPVGILESLLNWLRPWASRSWRIGPGWAWGGAQTRDMQRQGQCIGPDGLVSMQGLHPGARWMLCMRRQGGGSARRGAPEHASPELGSDQLALLPLHCPWGGSECHPECIASGSRWGEGLAGCGDAWGRTRNRGNATETSPPSPNANPGPASCRGTLHELTATRMVDSRPMGALGRGRIR